MKMLEKMARAMAAAGFDDAEQAEHFWNREMSPSHQDSYREKARAALEAIRDHAQTDEGHRLLNDALKWERNADQDFTAMIDAILSEE